MPTIYFFLSNAVSWHILTRTQSPSTPLSLLSHSTRHFTRRHHFSCCRARGALKKKKFPCLFRSFLFFIFLFFVFCFQTRTSSSGSLTLPSPSLSTSEIYSAVKKLGQKVKMTGLTGSSRWGLRKRESIWRGFEGGQRSFCRELSKVLRRVCERRDNTTNLHLTHTHKHSLSTLSLSKLSPLYLLLLLLLSSFWVFLCGLILWFINSWGVFSFLVPLN